jgi:hypothetical protein
MLVWNAPAFKNRTESKESERFWNSLLRDIAWASESYARSNPGFAAYSAFAMAAYGVNRMAYSRDIKRGYLVSFSRN